MTDRSRRKNDAGRRARALLAVLFAAAAAGCGGPGAERDPAAVAEDRGAWRADVRISSARLREAMDAGDCDTAMYIVEKVFSFRPGRGRLERGKFYEFGECVPQDWGRARSLYEQSAAAGDFLAYAYLGHMYARGLGVARDPVQAGYWYRGFVGSFTRSSPEERLETARKAMADRGVDAELDQALAWGRALDGRSPDEWLDVAGRFERGDGVPKNLNLARDWADKAMRGGSARAPVVFARLAFNEATENSIWYSGLRALEVAGAEGNRYAQLDLARRFEQGDGLVQSDRNAYQWLLLARASGAEVSDKLREVGARLSDAKIEIAEMGARSIQANARRQAAEPQADQSSGPPEAGAGHDAGEKNSAMEQPIDCDSPMPPSDASPAKRGDAFNMRGVLIAYGECDPQDWRLARHYFEQAAALGNRSAYAFLGHVYAQGRGVPADPVRARYWYRGAAAASTHIPAEERLPLAIFSMWVPGFDEEYRDALAWARSVEDQTPKDWFALARRIELGDGLPANIDVAATWMDKAAKAGHNEARLAFATWVLGGRLDSRRPWEGWLQLQLAARDGYMPAQLELADRLAAGRGLPRNDPHAFFWLLVAKARGADVSSRLADVGARLTAGEREKAAEWARDPNSSPAASDSILSRRKLLNSDR